MNPKYYNEWCVSYKMGWLGSSWQWDLKYKCIPRKRQFGTNNETLYTLTDWPIICCVWKFNGFINCTGTDVVILSATLLSFDYFVQSLDRGRKRWCKYALFITLTFSSLLLFSICTWTGLLWLLHSRVHLIMQIY